MEHDKSISAAEHITSNETAACEIQDPLDNLCMALDYAERAAEQLDQFTDTKDPRDLEDFCELALMLEQTAKTLYSDFLCGSPNTEAQSLPPSLEDEDNVDAFFRSLEEFQDAYPSIVDQPNGGAS